MSSSPGRPLGGRSQGPQRLQLLIRRRLRALQVIGDLVIASSNASLSNLKVNGETVPGFDPATTHYTFVTKAYPPVITATAADNGSVAIQPPGSLPGTATVTVTSEDGLQTKTYSVDIRGRRA